MIACAVTDLPDPDSPTSATVEPGSDAERDRDRARAPSMPRLSNSIERSRTSISPGMTDLLRCAGRNGTRRARLARDSEPGRSSFPSSKGRCAQAAIRPRRCRPQPPSCCAAWTVLPGTSRECPDCAVPSSPADLRRGDGPAEPRRAQSLRTRRARCESRRTTCAGPARAAASAARGSRGARAGARATACAVAARHRSIR